MFVYLHIRGKYVCILCNYVVILQFTLNMVAVISKGSVAEWFDRCEEPLSAPAFTSPKALSFKYFKQAYKSQNLITIYSLKRNVPQHKQRQHTWKNILRWFVRLSNNHFSRFSAYFLDAETATSMLNANGVDSKIWGRTCWKQKRRLELQNPCRANVSQLKSLLS